MFVWRRRVLAGVVVAVVLVAGYFFWFRDSSLVAVDEVEVEGRDRQPGADRRGADRRRPTG